jgi:hypothetical protein
VEQCAGPAALAPGLRWCRVFPGQEAQLRLLRRWLETLLPDCPARDDVSCIATELGTNAILFFLLSSCVAIAV